MAPTSTTTMPRLGLGTWRLTGDRCADAVRTALELGYRHLDTAQMYGNERQVGRAIADSGIDRDDLWITTKLDNGNHAPAAVVASTERSLADLGVEDVDLLLIHWPVEVDQLEATLEAMQGLRDRGLVRHVGVSNFTADLVRRAARVTDVCANQVEYHVLLDQSAVRAATAEVGAVLTAYSPLATGEALSAPAVVEIAEQRGASPAQVALRWLLDQDGVAVIPKGSSREHLAANLDALSMGPLTEEERARLDALPKDRRQIDPPSAPHWD